MNKVRQKKERVRQKQLEMVIRKERRGIEIMKETEKEE